MALRNQLLHGWKKVHQAQRLTRSLRCLFRWGKCLLLYPYSRKAKNADGGQTFVPFYRIAALNLTPPVFRDTKRLAFHKGCRVVMQDFSDP